MALPEDKCSARSGECQFADITQHNLYKYQGAHYCSLHLPVDADRKDNCNFDNILATYIRSKRLDLTLVQFPIGGNPVLNEAHGELLLDSCVFPGDRVINIASARIVNSTFTGNVRFVVHHGTLRVRATFPSRVELSVQGAKIIDFSHSIFLGKVVIGESMSGTWSFAFARFHRQLILRDSAVPVPRQISFTSAQFKRTACPDGQEGNYRFWRKQFEDKSDRENEGLFYALEKRCHRHGLPPRSLARWVSALYDWVSVYGQSYEKAFRRFLCVQCVAFLVYGVKSEYILIAPFDPKRFGELVAFTLSQVAKPFELLSARGLADGGLLATVIGGQPLTGWALISLTHSVLSLVTLALFILALRWRFRRA